MLFSEAVRQHDTETQRRLYSLFTRAVKSGEIPALKLLDRMTVTGRNGQAREVQDFAIPESAEQQLDVWVNHHANKPTATRKGFTAQQVEAMTEEYLLKLIAQQNKPKAKRGAKRGKAKAG